MSLIDFLGVVGPTASGKSALAVRLARELAGEVVTLDSVQVFRGFDIGSAKISPEEMRGVPHHLLGVLEPNQGVNAADFVRLAQECIQEIKNREKLPVVVGGTTMYLSALLHGLADLPPAQPEIRERYQHWSDHELHQELQKFDPESAARLHPADRMRTMRALEIFLESGKTANALRLEHRFQSGSFSALLIVPCWKRAELYRRIEARTREMVECGLLAECAGLRQTYGEDLHGLRALGYAQALEVLRGELPESELVSVIQQATRRFAKRQMTYLRNEPLKRGWTVEPSQPTDPEVRPLREGSKKRVREFEFRAERLCFDDLVARIRSRLRSETRTNAIWYVEAEALE